MIWFECYRLVKICDSLVIITYFVVCPAEIIISFGKVWSKFYRFVKVSDGMVIRFFVVVSDTTIVIDDGIQGGPVVSPSYNLQWHGHNPL